MFRVAQPYLNLLVKPRIFSGKYDFMHFEKKCVPTLPKIFRHITRNTLNQPTLPSFEKKVGPDQLDSILHHLIDLKSKVNIICNSPPPPPQKQNNFNKHCPLFVCVAPLHTSQLFFTPPPPPPTTTKTKQF